MTKVWVLIHQYSEDGDAGYVYGVFPSEEAAESARVACINDAISQGSRVFNNPTTGEEDTNWDEDYVVEMHEIQVAA